MYTQFKVFGHFMVHELRKTRETFHFLSLSFPLLFYDVDEVPENRISFEILYSQKQVIRQY